MKFIISVIIILIVMFFIIMILIPKLKYNKAKKVLLTYPNVKEVKNKKYDFIMETKDKKYLIKVIDIPSNSLITINSKETWRLSWGGPKRDLGRAYPNHKYLDELKPFLMMPLNSETPITKIILLVDETEKIVKYLNESELEVVTFKDSPYGYKIMELKKIDEQMQELGIKKS